jgi:xanthine dehydrogenase accessory factor
VPATRAFDRLAELERANATFAVATVVGRRAPVSSSLGDRAVIFSDGRMEGFVGGACARDIVRSYALGALRDGRSQLVQIRPGVSSETRDPERAEERVLVPMGCASEGEIDIYIEPHFPRRRLAVIGFTPVADALVRAAVALDYDVTRFVLASEASEADTVAGASVRALDTLAAFCASLDRAEQQRLPVVVASQGHYDETALEVLLAFPLGYVGVLASRKRMAAVRGCLAQSGVAEAGLARVHNPIGLAIGARSPAEIAISILGEIVALGSGPVAEAAPAPAAQPAVTAVDPICGMTVQTAGAEHRFEHSGTTYFFCCAGCGRRFAAEPERYAVALART